MRIREKGSGVMFGTETISEFECDAARRTFLLRPRHHAEGQPPARGRDAGDSGVWSSEDSVSRAGPILLVGF